MTTLITAQHIELMSESHLPISKKLFDPHPMSSLVMLVFMRHVFTPSATRSFSISSSMAPIRYPVIPICGGVEWVEEKVTTSWGLWPPSALFVYFNIHVNTCVLAITNFVCLATASRSIPNVFKMDVHFSKHDFLSIWWLEIMFCLPVICGCKVVCTHIAYHQVFLPICGTSSDISA